MFTFHFSTYPADGAVNAQGDNWWLHSETEETDGIEPIAFTPSDPEDSNWESDIDRALRESGYRRLGAIAYDEYDSTFKAERIGTPYAGCEVQAKPMGFVPDCVPEIPVGAPVLVRPVVVQKIHGTVDLYLFDLITGNPLDEWITDRWDGCGKPYWKINLDKGADRADNCLIIRDVYGEDDEEFTRDANAKLEKYGFKLGQYVEKPFRFNANVNQPDKYLTSWSDYYLLEEA